MLASRDGKMWKTIGVKKEKGLPGVATEQLVSSDPNKFQDIVSLPLRKITTEVPLDKKENMPIFELNLKCLGQPGGVSMRLELLLGCRLPIFKCMAIRPIYFCKKGK